MDPNLFHLDWERTFEALVTIIILSFFIERTCALAFESRWYIRLFSDSRVGAGGSPPKSDADDEGTPDADEGTPTTETPPADGQGVAAAPDVAGELPGRLYPIKEVVAFTIAGGVCYVWDFDAISMVLLRPQTHLLGILITAAVIAGGSKASIALFHHVLKVQSSALQERAKFKKLDAEGSS